YCIVPKVRGREKSINKKLIVNEINDLHERGYKEIILTGTQLGSYGFDLINENLETLIKYIMTETSIERLRISSIQAHEISEELLDIYSKYSQRICNHFHLALQSGSNNILKLMRRKYDNSRYLEAVNLIKSKLANPSISTDVIVGFPGETEIDFNDTIKLIKSSKFSKIHFFPYSDRPGTSSYYFNNKIKPEIKKERMKIALQLAKTEESTYRRNVLNQTRNILWEKPLSQSPSIFEGYSEDYLRIQTESDYNLYNKITPVILQEFKKDYLIGKVL
ncbi:MAG: MiaB/RimO family radical SAM methylthiotransferase, partial [SAR202 cluster bacterium]|nr:MiaB/RimO family radical SAM methylthiotransferase [SAR202 cluster bacterium]